MSNKMIGHFEDKPLTEAYCQRIESYLKELPNIGKELKSQLSYKVKRKFLWMWTYEKTRDGILYLSLMLDEEIKDDRIHNVSQVSAKRWNHSIVIKDKEEIESSWFQDLLLKGYAFAGR
ncbi:MAG: DUF5655 domain-containing protein [Fretibacterium sp.]|nr:DUF5655 domain-containing protein [Fretibacterium sp.]